MHTALDIDDDVLRAARELARREKKTVGRVISELARKALISSSAIIDPGRLQSVHGFRPFPRRGSVVTNDVIDRLRGKDAY